MRRRISGIPAQASNPIPPRRRASQSNVRGSVKRSSRSPKLDWPYCEALSGARMAAAVASALIVGEAREVAGTGDAFCAVAATGAAVAEGEAATGVAEI